MSLHNSSTAYGLISKLLHWVIALAIFAQIGIALCMEYLSGPVVAKLYFVHKSIGLTMVFLSVIWLVWRFTQKKPPYLAGMSRWQKWLATCVHDLMSALVFIMAFSGWFMSTASGYIPSFWGWFKMAAPVMKSKMIAGVCDDIHGICAWILCGLILLHILAVVKHVMVNRDGTLRRMM
jgi:cytochrome b561